MTVLEKLILDELDEAEGSIHNLSGNLVTCFGFDPFEKGNSYQDKLNKNVLTPNGRNRV